MSSISYPRNNPYTVSLASSRHSVSEERTTIDDSVVQGVRISEQEIPHGIYGGPFDHHNQDQQDLRAGHNEPTTYI
jgi:hypothetical protein